MNKISDRRVLAGWAGMIGSALFVTVFTLEGWLRPGYDWRSTFISELSIGPRGWVQIVNFIMLGTLFLCSRGVWRTNFGRARPRKRVPFFWRSSALVFWSPARWLPM